MKYLECVFDLCAEDDDEPVEAGEEENDDDEPVRHDVVAGLNLPSVIETKIDIDILHWLPFSCFPQFHQNSCFHLWFVTSL